jgi:hypothetical protein
MMGIANDRCDRIKKKFFRENFRGEITCEGTTMGAMSVSMRGASTRGYTISFFLYLQCEAISLKLEHWGVTEEGDKAAESDQGSEYIPITITPESDEQIVSH